MKVNKFFKIVIIGFLALSFNACEEEKEVKSTPTLPIPEVEESHINKYFKLSLYLNAKHDPIPATKIGYAYSEELKDYEKALEWYVYSDPLKSLPDNSNYACYALQELKKYDEAIPWCEKAIELGSSEAVIGLGYSYSNLGDYKEALKWYSLALEKNHPDALLNIGTTYFNLKDYKNSEISYKKAIENNDYQAYQSIAKLYHEALNDDIKASAYAIALINVKYTKKSVLNLLQKDWKIPNNIIKQGYELQLNSPDFPIKYEGELFE